MKKITTLVTVLIFAIIARSQSNFTGTWGEPELEMIEGKQHSNALPTKIIVSQTKDSIKVERTEVGAGAPATQVIALNGKVFERVGKTSKRTIRTTATWSSDKRSLTISTTYSYAKKPSDLEYNNIEVWEIQDGKLVITKFSDATVTDDWKIKGVYILKTKD